MTLIIPFVSAVFEPAEIKVMSEAYNKAIEDVHGFGHRARVGGAMNQKVARTGGPIGWRASTIRIKFTLLSGHDLGPSGEG